MTDEVTKSGRLSLLGARKRPDAGFTLIEVLVALGIFIAVSAATITILLMALATVRENSDRVLAANVARSHVEQLKVLGSSNISIGLSESVDSGFTVRTTTNWVGVDQKVSACSASEPGQDYLRVNVEVSGRTLGAAQVIDAVINSDGAPRTGLEGAVTAQVGDQYARPVTDVTVTGLDTSHPENNFQVLTGNDGCVFLPNLAPSGTLYISIEKSQPGVTYVTRAAGGETSQIQINSQEVSRATFEYAPAASIVFQSLDASYQLPAALSVTWQELITGAESRQTPVVETVSGIWPATGGFQAWLGNCSDQDPREFGSQPTDFGLISGSLVSVGVPSAYVRFEGLSPEGIVEVSYAGSDGSCDLPAFTVGPADEEGTLEIALPFGAWDFVSEDEDPIAPVDPLAPPEPGQIAVPVVVAFALTTPEELP
tara:strand:- start:508 stop:1788 length:1281 start_codon:yes stop_codon:yes gene_type:complete